MLPKNKQRPKLARMLPHEARRVYIECDVSFIPCVVEDGTARSKIRVVPEVPEDLTEWAGSSGPIADDLYNYLTGENRPVGHDSITQPRPEVLAPVETSTKRFPYATADTESLSSVQRGEMSLKAQLEVFAPVETSTTIGPDEAEFPRATWE